MHRSSSVLRILHASTLIVPAVVAATSLDQVINAALPSVASDICGRIVNANLYSDQYWFYASDVVECLTSVPLNKAVADRFITYVNQTWQFQSTISTLKSPPATYQQPAIDLLAGLKTIRQQVAADSYRNQYAFEVDVQKLVLKAHDAHLSLSAGILDAFSFGSPYDLVSVSSDGKQAPKVYFYDDLTSCFQNATCDMKKQAAIRNINGIDAVQFLEDFAKEQAFGFLEPHADWNSLFRTPALDIQDGSSTFSGGANIYPGDQLNFTFEDGTTVSDYWISLYNSPGYTGPLSTGGDFFNFFALGNIPASYNATEYYAETDIDYDDVAPANITSWHNISAAYPLRTLISQSQLGLYTPGVVTGYLLDDKTTAVLSVPTFAVYDEGISTFSQAVADFTNKSASVHRVIIDLQQNSGGSVGLALDTFRMFFPSLVPSPESRMRATPAVNALGQTFTSHFSNITDDEEALDFIAEEWVSSRRINARTGRRFASWSQFFGPSEGGFTLSQRYNLTDKDFVAAAFGIEFPDEAFVSDPSAAPWSGDEIILLTDGQCSSACSLFVEMMTRVKGVRTVVVGGAPKPGPMQAVSGNRGAAAYSGDELDEDITFARQINSSTRGLLPQRGNLTDTGMSIAYAAINLRDQIRANTSTANQFLYLPADCRLYWSFDNFFDYSRLWSDAARLFKNDTSLCVPGSINAKTPSKRRWQPRSVASKSFSTGDFIMRGVSGEELAPTHDSDIVHDDAAFAPVGKPRSCGDKTKKDGKDDNLCSYDRLTRCTKVETKCTDCLEISEDGCSDEDGGIKTDVSWFCLRDCQFGAAIDKCKPYGHCGAKISKNSQGTSQASTLRGPSKSNKKLGTCTLDPPRVNIAGTLPTCKKLRSSRQ